MKITALDDLRRIEFNGREFGIFQDSEILAGDVYSLVSAGKAVAACACGASLDDADLEIHMVCEEHRDYAADSCELCEEEEEESDEDSDEE